MERVADVPQDPAAVRTMLKASRLRVQERREQIMARQEQLVIDREVRASERLLSKGRGSFASAPARIVSSANAVKVRGHRSSECLEAMSRTAGGDQSEARIPAGRPLPPSRLLMSHAGVSISPSRSA